MKKIFYSIFGMPFMAVLLIVFAISIGYATFIEDMYGTTASKAVIYNAKWFEAIMVVLAISLVVNVFRFKMYRMSKLPVLLFHLAFIVIVLGAAFTRYNSIDGMMHIREGSSSDYFGSSASFLQTKISNGTTSEYQFKKSFLSMLSPEDIDETIKFDGQKFKFESQNYIPSASGRLAPFETGRPVAQFMISSNDQRQELLIGLDDVNKMGDMIIAFKEYPKSDISLKVEDGQLYIKSIYSGSMKSMTQGIDSTLVPGIYYPFNKQLLYSFDKAMIVLMDYLPKGEIMFFTDQSEQTNKPDVVEMKYEYQGVEKRFFLRGGSGFRAVPYLISDNGYTIEVSYGPRYYQLPFAVALNDFIIERYPGSRSPSSFLSDVQVIDSKGNKIMDYSIYMNHIMNYDGYRFFQSSYDTDEKGTILSVNYDKMGMRTTYLGYFLMILGMLLALVWKGSQFRGLLRKLSSYQQKAALVFVILFGMAASSFAQSEAALVPDKDQAKKFGELWIQEKEGRIKPLHSYNLDLLRKIYGKATYEGYSADQVILGMMMNPGKWYDEKIIKVANKNLNERLGLEGKYASFRNFFDMETGSQYKLQNLLDQSNQKFPAERSKFDRDVIAIDERVNIYSMLQYQMLFTIFPDPDDTHKPWYSSNSKLNNIPEMDSLFIKTALSMYLGYLQSGDSENAEFMIDGLSNYQAKNASSVLPSDTQKNMEVLYDRYNIFSKLAIVYLLLGILAIFLVFGHIFRGKGKPGFGIKALKIALWLAVIIHAAGIGIRWYISGYAPFSNGYEAMIFISWSGLFAGLLLSRKSLLLIPVVTLFAAAPLLVAYLTLMNPDITNLVPVLKSYWLSIHVATITSSYGVLGSVFFGSLLSLILMVIKTPKNKEKIDRMINELTTLNQLSTILGLYLLTIGCFLGGIWANESWGTYWSWDPKETWCLVSILVYSFTAHLKFIPGLQTNFAFNFAAFWSYSAIIMTYFGVNFFLGGMHSYAKGDEMSIPMGYYVAIAAFFILSLIAGYKERNFENNLE
ncbi:MAG: cytochrome c biogenesis protein CcsA [Bacteroidales bacterium]|nr:cytochrome c biogenesis protein CcsA [Bacteroidales bacterium]MCF8457725.1 cytochrome c biogenesis protein CcsA [Bacteroidales bacterium]